MALYHLSVKTVSRSSGRSAPAAAAYRTGSRITNERDGVTHDYTRRAGVESSFIVAPAGTEAWAKDRVTLWNRAEAAETRKNSTVAREYELALPAELDAGGRAQLARTFAAAVVERYGVVADVALHAPGREGDQRNHHAHVLTTTRSAGPDGFGAKTRVLDDQKSGAIEEIRQLWADQVNQALERAQVQARVDHRSYARQDAEQGRDVGDRVRAAGIHLGPAAAAIERRAARDRVRSLPERAGTLERQRAARSVGASRRGDLANQRQSDHLTIAMARQQAREASATVTSLDEERARRAAQEAQATREAKQAPERQERPKPAEQDEAARKAAQQRQRWQAMTPQQLGAEIERLQPRPMAEIVPEVAQADQALTTANRAVAEAEKAADPWLFNQTRAELDRERKALRGESRRIGIVDRASVWLHDKGIFRQKVLVEIDQARAAVDQRQAAAGEVLKEAQSVAQKAAEEQKATYARWVPIVQAEQEPNRKMIAEISEIRKSKVLEKHQEQQKEAKAKGRDRGMER